MDLLVVMLPLALLTVGVLAIVKRDVFVSVFVLGLIALIAAVALEVLHPYSLVLIIPLALLALIASVIVSALRRH